MITQSKTRKNEQPGAESGNTQVFAEYLPSARCCTNISLIQFPWENHKLAHENFHFWPRGSNRDRIFPLTGNNQKLNKMCRTTICKTLDIKQQKTVILERWEVREVSTSRFPAYCTDRVFGPWLRERELRWSLADSLNGGARAESPGRPR